MIVAVLVGPACQRLERHDRPRRQIADRLVGQPERAVLDRAAQRCLHPELLARDDERVGLIAFAMPAFLGALHCELRVADHLLGVVALVRSERDTDRTFHADLVIGQAERRRQCALDPARELVRLAAVLVDRHQNAEFVPADPRKQIARAQRALDPARDGDQQFVSHQRSQARVQPPEPRQVDHQQRMALAVAVHVLDNGAEALAIGQPGQAVGRHLAAQAAFGVALRRLIDQGHHAPVARRRLGPDQGDAVMPGIDQLADAPGKIGAHRIRIEKPRQPFAQRHQRLRSPLDRAQPGDAEGGIGLFQHQPATAARDDGGRHRHQIEHVLDLIGDGQRLGSRDGAGKDHWGCGSSPLVKAV